MGEKGSDRLGFSGLMESSEKGLLPFEHGSFAALAITLSRKIF